MSSNLSYTPSSPTSGGAESKRQVHSTLVSRNVTVSGKRTSVRLEPEMWDGLREICRRERANLHQLCTSISLQKSEQTSLTAAIRVFAMRYFRLAATEQGHSKAGRGFGLTLALGGGSHGGLSGSPSYTPPMMVLTKTSFA